MRTEPPLDRAARLLTMIEGAAEGIEDAQRLTEPLVTALHDARLFRLLLPQALGGEESAPEIFLALVEAIAHADASTAWCIAQTSVCAMAAALLPRHIASELFDDPRAILAWGYAPDARAVRHDGFYMVSGEWSFGSGIQHATWLGGPCVLHEPDGEPCLDSAGRPITRMMLFPAAAAEISETWQVIGLCGSGSNAYRVTDLHVPEAFAIRLGDPVQPHADSRLYLLPLDSLWASGFACVALGLARAMLDAGLAAARGKPPRGARERLAGSATVQAQFARCDAQWRAARCFLFTTIGETWRQLETEPRVSLAQRMTIRLAASHAIEQADMITQAIWRAMGSTAVSAAGPFERRLRDMHMITQHVHGRHAHYETVGQFMLGVSPNLAYL